MRSGRHSSLNFTRKSRADERQAGRKGNENPKPMRFSAGFSLLARPLYLIPHRKSTAAKNLCLPCSMKKRGFPIFFLGFVRIFSDFRQNSVMLKILCILMQKLLQFVHIPGFRKRLRLHAFCGKRRSFIKRAALPLFGRPPNWVSRALTVQWTVNAPVLIFG